jgi:hypothetical protein
LPKACMLHAVITTSTAGMPCKPTPLKHSLCRHPHAATLPIIAHHPLTIHT